MSRIGVFGGSFNPVHNAHIQLAVGAIERFELSACYVIPTFVPPHKTLASSVSPTDRMKMTRDAFCTYDKIIVSDMEQLRGGTSYTYVTLQELKAQHQDDTLFLIVGADMLADIATWKKPDIILSLAEVIAVTRNGTCNEVLYAAAEKLEHKYGAKIHFADIHVADISSTEVRDCVEKYMPIDGLVPFCVERYVYENGLYQEEQLGHIIQILRARLDDERFSHVVCTMREAIKLATQFSLDTKKAAYGGLLHDCAKIRGTDYLKAASDCGIELDETERRAPALIHAKLSAYVAEHDFSITDTEILNAILHHTVGLIGMSELEKVVFVADKIEALRNYPGVDEIREAAKESLDRAMLVSIERSYKLLEERGYAIHEQTRRLYEHLKNIC